MTSKYTPPHQKQREEAAAMGKVHAARAITLSKNHVVRLSKISVVYSCLYVVSLVTEPLKAYASEPFPWTLQSTSINPKNVSFDDYVNTTYHAFALKYNNVTMAPQTLFSHDQSTNTVVLRFNMSLPANDVDHCNSHLVQIPGSIFFGAGMVEYVCHFIAQNASTQLFMPRYMCQYITVANLFALSESCVWMEPLLTQGQFRVYHGLRVVEEETWSWTKLWIRLAISSVIAIEIWRLYYRHFGPLLSNLTNMGIQNYSCDSVYYVLQLGDPTWLILSHPFVCTAMVVDNLYSSSYSAVALFRVSQLEDILQFAIGSFYGSNLVWGSYAAMRFSTPAIKFLRCENYFEPVEPGIMALSATLYAGPMVYIICQTPLVLFFQYLNQVFPQRKMEANEVSLGMANFLIMFASLPLLYSLIMRYFHIRRMSMFIATSYQCNISGRAWAKEYFI
ncbi:Aste57867_19748 [Aphanomyces stellatus]|uniref:Aste57867_19748 protein n=1 Tax=Aphanomyces stellatus TaxID=120398 RepID=A0A485LDA9_9STRA|nr:hypothetical protein As57867_019683 [Aphanomyces stellatus]VFT96446.1 Aste57867_19748 [Aphanomyces stellatus]